VKLTTAAKLDTLFEGRLPVVTNDRFRDFFGSCEIDPRQTSEPSVAGSSPAGRTWSWLSSGGVRPEGIATPESRLQVQVLPGVLQKLDVSRG
jgi:hypothetical protein